MVAAIDPLIANRPVDVYGRRSLLERAAELKLLAGTVRTLGRQVSPALRALIPSPTRNTKVTYLVFRLQAKYDSMRLLGKGGLVSFSSQICTVIPAID